MNRIVASAVALIAFSAGSASAQEFDWKTAPETIKAIAEGLKAGKEALDIAKEIGKYKELGKDADKAARQLLDNVERVFPGLVPGAGRKKIQMEWEFKEDLWDESKREFVLFSVKRCRKVFVAKDLGNPGDPRNPARKDGAVQLLVLNKTGEVRHAATISSPNTLTIEHNLGEVVVVIYPRVKPGESGTGMYFHIEWEK